MLLRFPLLKFHKESLFSSVPSAEALSIHSSFSWRGNSSVLPSYITYLPNTGRW